MATHDFTKSAKLDALDIKAQNLNDQIEQLGWSGALETFCKLAERRSDLTSEAKKLLLVDYLETYLDVRKKYPNEGVNVLIALVSEARSEARTDKLTKIGNRRAFEEKFMTEQSIIARMNSEQGRNSQYQSAIISFDVNGLKAVNDKLGHEAGDKFIQHFSDVVSNAVRPNDVLFRIGGDEFVLLVPDSDQSGCDTIIENIRGALDKNPFTYKGTQVTMKTGAGVAIFGAAHDKEEVLCEADQDLYEDKSKQPKSIMMAIHAGATARADVLSVPMR